MKTTRRINLNEVLQPAGRPPQPQPQSLGQIQRNSPLAQQDSAARSQRQHQTADSDVQFLQCEHPCRSDALRWLTQGLASGGKNPIYASDMVKTRLAQRVGSQTHLQLQLPRLANLTVSDTHPEAIISTRVVRVPPQLVLSYLLYHEANKGHERVGQSTVSSTLESLLIAHFEKALTRSREFCYKHDLSNPDSISVTTLKSLLSTQVPSEHDKTTPEDKIDRQEGAYVEIPHDIPLAQAFPFVLPPFASLVRYEPRSVWSRSNPDDTKQRARRFAVCRNMVLFVFEANWEIDNPSGKLRLLLALPLHSHVGNRQGGAAHISGQRHNSLATSHQPLSDDELNQDDESNPDQEESPPLGSTPLSSLPSKEQSQDSFFTATNVAWLPHQSGMIAVSIMELLPPPAHHSVGEKSVVGLKESQDGPQRTMKLVLDEALRDELDELPVRAPSTEASALYQSAQLNALPSHSQLQQLADVARSITDDSRGRQFQIMAEEVTHDSRTFHGAAWDTNVVATEALGANPQSQLQGFPPSGEQGIRAEDLAQMGVADSVLPRSLTMRARHFVLLVDVVRGCIHLAFTQSKAPSNIHVALEPMPKETLSLRSSADPNQLVDVRKSAALFDVPPTKIDLPANVDLPLWLEELATPRPGLVSYGIHGHSSDEFIPRATSGGPEDGQVDFGHFDSALSKQSGAILTTSSANQSDSPTKQETLSQRLTFSEELRALDGSYGELASIIPASDAFPLNQLCAAFISHPRVPGTAIAVIGFDGASLKLEHVTQRTKRSTFTSHSRESLDSEHAIPDALKAMLANYEQLELAPNVGSAFNSLLCQCETQLHRGSSSHRSSHCRGKLHHSSFPRKDAFVTLDDTDEQGGYSNSSDVPIVTTTQVHIVSQFVLFSYASRTRVPVLPLDIRSQPQAQIWEWRSTDDSLAWTSILDISFPRNQSVPECAGEGSFSNRVRFLSFNPSALAADSVIRSAIGTTSSNPLANVDGPSSLLELPIVDHADSILLRTVLDVDISGVDPPPVRAIAQTGEVKELYYPQVLLSLPRLGQMAIQHQSTLYFSCEDERLSTSLTLHSLLMYSIPAGPLVATEPHSAYVFPHLVSLLPFAPTRLVLLPATYTPIPPMLFDLHTAATRVLTHLHSQYLSLSEAMPQALFTLDFLGLSSDIWNSIKGDTKVNVHNPQRDNPSEKDLAKVLREVATRTANSLLAHHFEAASQSHGPATKSDWVPDHQLLIELQLLVTLFLLQMRTFEAPQQLIKRYAVRELALVPVRQLTHAVTLTLTSTSYLLSAAFNSFGVVTISSLIPAKVRKIVQERSQLTARLRPTSILSGSLALSDAERFVVLGDLLSVALTDKVAVFTLARWAETQGLFSVDSISTRAFVSLIRQGLQTGELDVVSIDRTCDDSDSNIKRASEKYTFSPLVSVCDALFIQLSCRTSLEKLHNIFRSMIWTALVGVRGGRLKDERGVVLTPASLPGLQVILQELHTLGQSQSTGVRPTSYDPREMALVRSELFSQIIVLRQSKRLKAIAQAILVCTRIKSLLDLSVSKPVQVPSPQRLWTGDSIHDEYPIQELVCPTVQLHIHDFNPKLCSARVTLFIYSPSQSETDQTWLMQPEPLLTFELRVVDDALTFDTHSEPYVTIVPLPLASSRFASKFAALGASTLTSKGPAILNDADNWTPSLLALCAKATDMSMSRLQSANTSSSDNELTTGNTLRLIARKLVESQSTKPQPTIVDSGVSTCLDSHQHSDQNTAGCQEFISAEASLLQPSDFDPQVKLLPPSHLSKPHPLDIEGDVRDWAESPGVKMGPGCFTNSQSFDPRTWSTYRHLSYVLNPSGLDAFTLAKSLAEDIGMDQPVVGKFTDPDSVRLDKSTAITDALLLVKLMSNGMSHIHIRGALQHRRGDSSSVLSAMSVGSTESPFIQPRPSQTTESRAAPAQVALESVPTHVQDARSPEGRLNAISNELSHMYELNVKVQQEIQQLAGANTGVNNGPATSILAGEEGSSTGAQTSLPAHAMYALPLNPSDLPEVQLSTTVPFRIQAHQMYITEAQGNIPDNPMVPTDPPSDEIGLHGHFGNSAPSVSGSLHEAMSITSHNYSTLSSSAFVKTTHDLMAELNVDQDTLSSLLAAPLALDMLPEHLRSLRISHNLLIVVRCIQRLLRAALQLAPILEMVLSCEKRSDVGVVREDDGEVLQPERSSHHQRLDRRFPSAEPLNWLLYRRFPGLLRDFLPTHIDAALFEEFCQWDITHESGSFTGPLIFPEDINATAAERQLALRLAKARSSPTTSEGEARVRSLASLSDFVGDNMLQLLPRLPLPAFAAQCISVLSVRSWPLPPSLDVEDRRGAHFMDQMSEDTCHSSDLGDDFRNFFASAIAKLSSLTDGTAVSGENPSPHGSPNSGLASDKENIGLEGCANTGGRFSGIISGVSAREIATKFCLTVAEVAEDALGDVSTKREQLPALTRHHSFSLDDDQMDATFGVPTMREFCTALSLVTNWDLECLFQLARELLNQHGAKITNFVTRHDQTSLSDEDTFLAHVLHTALQSAVLFCPAILAMRKEHQELQRALNQQLSHPEFVDSSQGNDGKMQVNGVPSLGSQMWRGPLPSEIQFAELQHTLRLLDHVGFPGERLPRDEEVDIDQHMNIRAALGQTNDRTKDQASDVFHGVDYTAEETVVHQVGAGPFSRRLWGDGLRAAQDLLASLSDPSLVLVEEISSRIPGPNRQYLKTLADFHSRLGSETWPWQMLELASPFIPTLRVIQRRLHDAIRLEHLAKEESLRFNNGLMALQAEIKKLESQASVNSPAVRAGLRTLLGEKLVTSPESILNAISPSMLASLGFYTPSPEFIRRIVSFPGMGLQLRCIRCAPFQGLETQPGRPLTDGTHAHQYVLPYQMTSPLPPFRPWRALIEMAQNRRNRLRQHYGQLLQSMCSENASSASKCKVHADPSSRESMDSARPERQEDEPVRLPFLPLTSWTPKLQIPRSDALDGSQETTTGPSSTLPYSHPRFMPAPPMCGVKWSPTGALIIFRNHIQEGDPAAWSSARNMQEFASSLTTVKVSPMVLMASALSIDHTPYIDTAARLNQVIEASRTQQRVERSGNVAELDGSPTDLDTSTTVADENASETDEISLAFAPSRAQAAHVHHIDRSASHAFLAKSTSAVYSREIQTPLEASNQLPSQGVVASTAFTRPSQTHSSTGQTFLGRSPSALGPDSHTHGSQAVGGASATQGVANGGTLTSPGSTGGSGGTGLARLHRALSSIPSQFLSQPSTVSSTTGVIGMAAPATAAPSAFSASGSDDGSAGTVATTVMPVVSGLAYAGTASTGVYQDQSARADSLDMYRQRNEEVKRMVLTSAVSADLRPDPVEASSTRRAAGRIRDPSEQQPSTIAVRQRQQHSQVAALLSPLNSVQVLRPHLHGKLRLKRSRMKQAPTRHDVRAQIQSLRVLKAPAPITSKSRDRDLPKDKKFSLRARNSRSKRGSSTQMEAPSSGEEGMSGSESDRMSDVSDGFDEFETNLPRDGTSEVSEHTTSTRSTSSREKSAEFAPRGQTATSSRRTKGYPWPHRREGRWVVDHLLQADEDESQSLDTEFPDSNQYEDDASSTSLHHGEETGSENSNATDSDASLTSDSETEDTVQDSDEASPSETSRSSRSEKRADFSENIQKEFEKAWIDFGQVQRLVEKTAKTRKPSLSRSLTGPLETEPTGRDVAESGEEEEEEQASEKNEESAEDATLDEPSLVSLQDQSLPSPNVATQREPPHTRVQDDRVDRGITEELRLSRECGEMMGRKWGSVAQIREALATKLTIFDALAALPRCFESTQGEGRKPHRIATTPVASEPITSNTASKQAKRRRSIPLATALGHPEIQQVDGSKYLPFPPRLLLESTHIVLTARDPFEAVQALFQVVSNEGQSQSLSLLQGLAYFWQRWCAALDSQKLTDPSKHSNNKVLGLELSRGCPHSVPPIPKNSSLTTGASPIGLSELLYDMLDYSRRLSSHSGGGVQQATEEEIPDKTVRQRQLTTSIESPEILASQSSRHNPDRTFSGYISYAPVLYIKQPQLLRDRIGNGTHEQMVLPCVSSTDALWLTMARETASKIKDTALLSLVLLLGTVPKLPPRMSQFYAISHVPLSPVALLAKTTTPSTAETILSSPQSLFEAMLLSDPFVSKNFVPLPTHAGSARSSTSLAQGHAQESVEEAEMLDSAHMDDLGVYQTIVAKETELEKRLRVREVSNVAHHYALSTYHTIPRAPAETSAQSTRTTLAVSPKDVVDAILSRKQGPAPVPDPDFGATESGIRTIVAHMFPRVKRTHTHVVLPLAAPVTLPLEAVDDVLTMWDPQHYLSGTHTMGRLREWDFNLFKNTFGVPDSAESRRKFAQLTTRMKIFETTFSESSSSQGDCKAPNEVQGAAVNSAEVVEGSHAPAATPGLATQRRRKDSTHLEPSRMLSDLDIANLVREILREYPLTEQNLGNLQATFVSERGLSLLRPVAGADLLVSQNVPIASSQPRSPGIQAVQDVFAFIFTQSVLSVLMPPSATGQKGQENRVRVHAYQHARNLLIQHPEVAIPSFRRSIEKLQSDEDLATGAMASEISALSGQSFARTLKQLMVRATKAAMSELHAFSIKRALSMHQQHKCKTCSAELRNASAAIIARAMASSSETDSHHPQFDWPRPGCWSRHTSVLIPQLALISDDYGKRQVLALSMTEGKRKVLRLVTREIPNVLEARSNNEDGSQSPSVTLSNLLDGRSRQVSSTILDAAPHSLALREALQVANDFDATLRMLLERAHVGDRDLSFSLEGFVTSRLIPDCITYSFDDSPASRSREVMRRMRSVISTMLPHMVFTSDLRMISTAASSALSRLRINYMDRLLARCSVQTPSEKYQSVASIETPPHSPIVFDEGQKAEATLPPDQALHISPSRASIVDTGEQLAGSDGQLQALTSTDSVRLPTVSVAESEVGTEPAHDSKLTSSQENILSPRQVSNAVHADGSGGAGAGVPKLQRPTLLPKAASSTAISQLPQLHHPRASARPLPGANAGIFGHLQSGRAPEGANILRPDSPGDVFIPKLPSRPSTPMRSTPTAAVSVPTTVTNLGSSALSAGTTTTTRTGIASSGSGLMPTVEGKVAHGFGHPSSSVRGFVAVETAAVSDQRLTEEPSTAASSGSASHEHVKAFPINATLKQMIQSSATTRPLSSHHAPVHTTSSPSLAPATPHSASTGSRNLPSPSRPATGALNPDSPFARAKGPSGQPHNSYALPQPPLKVNGLRSTNSTPKLTPQSNAAQSLVRERRPSVASGSASHAPSQSTNYSRRQRIDSSEDEDDSNTVNESAHHADTASMSGEDLDVSSSAAHDLGGDNESSLGDLVRARLPGTRPLKRDMSVPKQLGVQRGSLQSTLFRRLPKQLPPRVSETAASEESLDMTHSSMLNTSDPHEIVPVPSAATALASQMPALERVVPENPNLGAALSESTDVTPMGELPSIRGRSDSSGSGLLPPFPEYLVRSESPQLLAQRPYSGNAGMNSDLLLRHERSSRTLSAYQGNLMSKLLKSSRGIYQERTPSHQPLTSAAGQEPKPSLLSMFNPPIDTQSQGDTSLPTPAHTAASPPLVASDVRIDDSSRTSDSSSQAGKSVATFSDYTRAVAELKDSSNHGSIEPHSTADAFVPGVKVVAISTALQLTQHFAPRVVLRADAIILELARVLDHFGEYILRTALFKRLFLLQLHELARPIAYDSPKRLASKGSDPSDAYRFYGSMFAQRLDRLFAKQRDRCVIAHHAHSNSVTILEHLDSAITYLANAKAENAIRHMGSLFSRSLWEQSCAQDDKSHGATATHIGGSATLAATERASDSWRAAWTDYDTDFSVHATINGFAQLDSSAFTSSGPAAACDISPHGTLFDLGLSSLQLQTRHHPSKYWLDTSRQLCAPDTHLTGMCHCLLCQRLHSLDSQSCNHVQSRTVTVVPLTGISRDSHSNEVRVYVAEDLDAPDFSKLAMFGDQSEHSDENTTPPAPYSSEVDKLRTYVTSIEDIFLNLIESSSAVSPATVKRQADTSANLPAATGTAHVNDYVNLCSRLLDCLAVYRSVLHAAVTQCSNLSVQLQMKGRYVIGLIRYTINRLEAVSQSLAHAFMKPTTTATDGVGDGDQAWVHMPIALTAQRLTHALAHRRRSKQASPITSPPVSSPRAANVPDISVSSQKPKEETHVSAQPAPTRRSLTEGSLNKLSAVGASDAVLAKYPPYLSEAVVRAGAVTQFELPLLRSTQLRNDASSMYVHDPLRSSRALGAYIAPYTTSIGSDRDRHSATLQTAVASVLSHISALGSDYVVDVKSEDSAAKFAQHSESTLGVLSRGKTRWLLHTGLSLQAKARQAHVANSLEALQVLATCLMYTSSANGAVEAMSKMTDVAPFVSTVGKTYASQILYQLQRNSLKLSARVTTLPTFETALDQLITVLLDAGMRVDQQQPSAALANAKLSHRLQKEDIAGASVVLSLAPSQIASLLHGTFALDPEALQAETARAKSKVKSKQSSQGTRLKERKNDPKNQVSKLTERFAKCGANAEVGQHLVTAPLCALCKQPCPGVSAMCAGCGHVMHLHCASDWWSTTGPDTTAHFYSLSEEWCDQQSCPSGCMCDCTKFNAWSFS